MATPSALQVASTYNWVSSMDAAQSILKPEIDPQLIRKYGDQDMTGFLEMQGAMNPVSALQYTHYEDDWLHTIVKLAAQGGGAANNTVSLTMGTNYTYQFPSTAQAPYIATGAIYVNPLRNGDIIQFPNGVQAYVSNISANTVNPATFDATPTVSGTAIPATLTTDQIIIIGNMFAEGTSQPGGRDSRVNRYTNNLQIFKSTYETTGSAMGVQTWIKVPDGKGNVGYLWYYEGQFRERRRFRNEMEVDMIVGKKTTNTTLTSITGQATNISTEGLIPFIDSNGNIYTYSSITGIQLADFETMIATQLDKNRGAKENTLWCGILLRQGIDAFMRDTMKNGGISYGAFNGDKEKAISFNFDSFILSGYTFHMKTYDVFNYPQLLGAAGQPYPSMGLVCPADNVTMSVGPDKKKETVPSMRINYLSQKNAGGSYSRDWEEWLTGGVNGIYTNQTDSIQYNIRAHRGLEAFAGNRFVKVIAS